MKTTNKKECPKCKGKNIVDTGDRGGSFGDYIPGKDIPEPKKPIYKCKDCGEYFYLIA